MTSSVISELTFYTNYILRNVVPCRTIGNVHDGSGGVRSWAEKNGFKAIFDFSTQQLSQIDLRDHDRPDALVCHNPFKDADVEGAQRILEMMRVAHTCIISAIPTKEHYQHRPSIVATVQQWRQNLSQIGTTVEVPHSDDHSLFLTLK